jgi:hypothetical protein
MEPFAIFEDRVPRGRVNIQIERLVIHGLPLTGRQATQLRTALQNELVRLVGSKGISLSGGAVPALAGHLNQIPSAAGSAILGRQIARSVHETLNRPI